MSSISRYQKLTRLFKTSAFRLTALYLSVFFIVSVSGLYYFSWTARQLISDYIFASVEEEGDELVRILNEFGIAALEQELTNRLYRNTSYFYVLTTYNGFSLGSNLDGVPREIIATPGWYEGHYYYEDNRNIWLSDKMQDRLNFVPNHLDKTQNSADKTDKGAKSDPETAETHATHDDMIEPSRLHLAVIQVRRIAGGLTLVVGKNSDELIRIDIAAKRARGAAMIIMILFGVLGGVYSIRRILKRVDSISSAMDKVATGQLSERLPLSGSGDELDRIAERVNHMLARIESLMKGIQDVSDNIAHDLKTPLTRLRNRVEEALRGQASEDDLREALGWVLEESDHLIRIFEALLQIARVESGGTELPKEEADINQFIADLAELYEPLIEDEGMTLTVTAEANLKAYINRELLGQALANLIENALKYGKKKDGKLTLVAERKPEGLIISLSDQGEGIAEEDRERALNRFTRLNSSRSTPGSGLGLSLAAAVCRFHDGEIILDDNHPGLIVRLVLPKV